MARPPSARDDYATLTPDEQKHVDGFVARKRAGVAAREPRRGNDHDMIVRDMLVYRDSLIEPRGVSAHQIAVTAEHRALKLVQLDRAILAWWKAKKPSVPSTRLVALLRRDMCPTQGKLQPGAYARRHAGHVHGDADAEDELVATAVTQGVLVVRSQVDAETEAAAREVSDALNRLHTDFGFGPTATHTARAITQELRLGAKRRSGRRHVIERLSEVTERNEETIKIAADRADKRRTMPIAIPDSWLEFQEMLERRKKREPEPPRGFVWDGSRRHYVPKHRPEHAPPDRPGDKPDS